MHIIRASSVKNYPNTDRLDFIHMLLYLLFDMLAFFLPYYMASWLNGLHHQYYKEMGRQLFEINIQCEANTFRFIPGKQINGSETKKKACSDYYNAAKEKNLVKTTDFDFVPAILGVSFPLSNPGYTFTILVSIMSILFKSGNL